MYKEDLALNNQQWLICYKIQPNQILYISYVCINRIWHKITYKGWYAIKANQPNFILDNFTHLNCFVISFYFLKFWVYWFCSDTNHGYLPLLSKKKEKYIL